MFSFSVNSEQDREAMVTKPFVLRLTKHKTFVRLVSWGIEQNVRSSKLAPMKKTFYLGNWNEDVTSATKSNVQKWAELTFSDMIVAETNRRQFPKRLCLGCPVCSRTSSFQWEVVNTPAKNFIETIQWTYQNRTSKREPFDNV